MKKKFTIPEFKEMKKENKKFAMITVYDYPMAALVEKSKAEMILVGDSLGMVIQGLDSTVPVNMEDVMYHLKCVRRGAPNTFVVGDMPFLSYQADKAEAIRNAGALMKLGADCVKLEGGMNIAETVRAIANAGIPVMAHIGLTPQTAASIGGFKVQGKSAEAAASLLMQALAMEEAGAFCVLIECIPAALAKLIDEKLAVPTISTGSGPDCTGFNLNAYDLLGIFDAFVPKFVKTYANMGGEMVKAFDNWCDDIEEKIYPAPEHTFKMNEEDLKGL
ncbi:MAG: 3-methyl-2-oxobutanoate hydroxymethyltransferase [Clostridiaceae bacterium]